MSEPLEMFTLFLRYFYDLLTNLLTSTDSISELPYFFIWILFVMLPLPKAGYFCLLHAL